MSILDRIKQQNVNKGNLIFVGGLRFGGKTTSLGTLPGKTLLLEVASKESGSLGAKNMAKVLDNKLDIAEVSDCSDVQNLIKEAINLDYDNIAIDGLSALSVVECEKPKISALLNSPGKAVFDGWRMVGNNITTLLQFLKDTSRDTNINIVLTVAMQQKADKNDVMQTTLELKGNMAEGFIKGLCPYFVVARLANDAEGKPLRIIQTYDDGVYNARLDGVFDKDNPKGFRADPDKVEPGQPVGLAAVIDFINKNKE